jgi:hypothetical protein
MANLILHKDGAYNIYTTIADGPCYESALTLDQLTEVIRMDLGEQGLRDLPARLDRAHRTGCSSMADPDTLEECISCNRAGPNETRLSFDEFVAKYLTLPSNAKVRGPEAALSPEAPARLTG